MNSADVYHRATCRLCDSRRFENVLPFLPSAIADQFVDSARADETQPEFARDAYLCLDCGHLQLRDVVSPDALFRDYIYRTSTSLGLQRHFTDLADCLLRELALPTDALVVEMGSNEGCLLEAFAQRGLRVLGIDPARAIAADATARGIPTIPQFFTISVAKRVRAEHGPANLVCANNVFAHIDDMHGAAEAVRTILAPDGVFVFEVVYVGDMLTSLLFDTIYHEHLATHALRPLQQFLARHELEVFDVDRISAKGGSIRVFAQPQKSGRYPLTSRMLNLLHEEDQRGICTPVPYRELYQTVLRRKQELRALLNELQAAGKRIAAYGAAPATITLLYEFELATYFECVYDDNPLKLGRLTPGHHLPVVASSTLAASGFDAVVILAWTYSKPIMDRNTAFLDRGGCFIIPLPQLRMYGATLPAAPSPASRLLST